MIFKEPPNLSKTVFRVSKASEKPLITLRGIPIPGGTDEGIGNALITLTPTLTPVIIPPTVLAKLSNVVNGDVIVVNAPCKAFF